jgi:hypothetical protein
VEVTRTRLWRLMGGEQLYDEMMWALWLHPTYIPRRFINAGVIHRWCGSLGGYQRSLYANDSYMSYHTLCTGRTCIDKDTSVSVYEKGETRRIWQVSIT